MSLQIIINGVDVTAFLDDESGNPLYYDLIVGSRGTANVAFMLRASNSLTVDEGQPVSINVGGSTVFLGSVDTIDETWLTNAGDRQCALTLVSMEQVYDKILVQPQAWFNQTAGYIITQLMASDCAGTPVGIGFIDTGATITSYLTDFTVASDVFDELARLSGFVWYVDPATGNFYFQAPSAAAPFTLTDSNIVWGSAEWQKNRQDYRNRLTLRASFSSFDSVSEMFTGDGVTTSFTLRDPVDSLDFGQITTAVRASGVGTFTGQPSPGDTITIGDVVYTFVSTLDNTQSFQILIGATDADSLQNLVDAINAKMSARGVTISLAMWPHDTCIAEAPSGLSFTVLSGYPGTVGDGHVLSASCANFGWSAGATSGGVDGTSSSLSTGLTTSASAQLKYTKGSYVVEAYPAPASGKSLLVAYYRLGQDCITVEDSASIAARAAVEGGTGIYHVLLSDSSATDILLEAQQTLATYNVLPETFLFITDTPGLSPGQQLPVALSLISNLGAIVNGTWLVQEVRGDYFIDSTNGTRFRYTVSVVSGNPALWLQFWEGLAGNGSSSGSSSVGGVSGGGGGGGGVATGVINPLPSSGNLVPLTGQNVMNQAVLSGSGTLKPPASATPSAWIMVQIQQDSSGGRTLAFDAFYKGLTGFVLDLTASTVASFMFQINSAGTAAQLFGGVPGNGGSIT